MKIALVSPYDFAFPGGVTVHIEQLAQEFIRQGHEAWIIAPSSQPADTVPFDRFVRLGVPVPVPAGGLRGEALTVAVAAAERAVSCWSGSASTWCTCTSR